MRFEEFNLKVDPVLTSAAFEDDGGIMVSSVQNQEDGIYLHIFIDGGEEENNSKWQIRATKVKEERLNFNWENDIQLTQVHPLLLPYQEDSADLFINAKVDNPAQMGVDIYDAHQKCYANAETSTPPLFIGKGFSLQGLCAKRSALFANGPVSIINKYAEVLGQHGGVPSVITFTRKRQRSLYENDPKILIIGQTFIIAESFDFSPA